MTHPAYLNESFADPACVAARQALELTLPGEPGSGAIADAQRHIEHCAPCQQALRRQEQWDARMRTVFRDVPVPDGLAEQIRTSLAVSFDAHARAEGDPSDPSTDITSHSVARRANSAANSITAEPIAANSIAAKSFIVQNGNGARLSRRRLRKAIGAVVACGLLTGAFVWHWLSRPTLRLDELITHVSVSQFDAEALPAPDEAAIHPTSGSLNGRIIYAPPRQLPNQAGVIYRFELPSGNGSKPVRGLLLVLAAARLLDPPESKAFLGQPAFYPGENRCASIWVEGEFAYVCLVEGGEDALQRLRGARPVAI